MGVFPWHQGFSALGVLVTSSLPALSTDNHAQPEPNWVAPAALKAVVKASNDPKSRAMASASFPVGSPPLLGPIDSQKKVWLTT